MSIDARTLCGAPLTVDDWKFPTRGEHARGIAGEYREWNVCEACSRLVRFPEPKREEMTR